MGYITYFDGMITISSKEKYNLVKKALLKHYEDWKDDFDFSDKQLEINIHGGWKNYHDEMENICLFIIGIDKDAKGEINCDGEEKEDIWKIILNDEKVTSHYAKIVFDEGVTNSPDIETLKKIHKVTKDEKLLKEIILSEMEDNNEKK